MLTPNNQENDGITLEISGTVVLGSVDPRVLSEKEFYESPDLIFHGTANEFTYSHDGDFSSEDVVGGSHDFGLGLYTTDNFEQAQNYSIWRQSEVNDSDQAIVYSFLPHQAKMLDVRDTDDPELNGVLPTEFVEAWVKYLETYFARETFSSVYIKNGIEDVINRTKKYLVDGEKVKIRGDESAGIFLVDGKAGLISHVFQNFMLELGYDGMIYREGGEGINREDLTGYVFYNFGSIDTWNGWQKRMRESSDEEVLAENEGQLNVSKEILEQGPNFKDLCSDCDAVRIQTHEGMQQARDIFAQSNSEISHATSFLSQAQIAKEEGNKKGVKELERQAKESQKQAEKLKKKALDVIDETRKSVIEDHTMQNQCVQKYLQSLADFETANILRTPRSINRAVDSAFEAIQEAENLLPAETMEVVEKKGFLGIGRKTAQIPLDENAKQQIEEILNGIEDQRGLNQIAQFERVDGKLTKNLVGGLLFEIKNQISLAAENSVPQRNISKSNNGLLSKIKDLAIQQYYYFVFLRQIKSTNRNEIMKNVKDNKQISKRLSQYFVSQLNQVEDNDRRHLKAVELYNHDLLLDFLSGKEGQEREFYLDLIESWISKEGGITSTSFLALLSELDKVGIEDRDFVINSIDQLKDRGLKYFNIGLYIRTVNQDERINRQILSVLPSWIDIFGLNNSFQLLQAVEQLQTQPETIELLLPHISDWLTALSSSGRDISVSQVISQVQKSSYQQEIVPTVSALLRLNPNPDQFITNFNEKEKSISSSMQKKYDSLEMNRLHAELSRSQLLSEEDLNSPIWKGLLFSFGDSADTMQAGNVPEVISNFISDPSSQAALDWAKMQEKHPILGDVLNKVNEYLVVQSRRSEMNDDDFYNFRRQTWIDIRKILSPYIIDTYLYGNQYQVVTLNSTTHELPISPERHFIVISQMLHSAEDDQLFDSLLQYHLLKYVLPEDRLSEQRYFSNYRFLFSLQQNQEGVDQNRLYRISWGKLYYQLTDVFEKLVPELLATYQSRGNYQESDPRQVNMSRFESFMLKVIQNGHSDLIEDYASVFRSYPLFESFQQEKSTQKLIDNPDLVRNAKSKSENERLAIVFKVLYGSTSFNNRVWDVGEGVFLSSEVVELLEPEMKGFYEYFSKYPLVRRVFNNEALHAEFSKQLKEMDDDDRTKLDTIPLSLLPEDNDFERNEKLAKHFKGFLDQFNNDGSVRNLGELVKFYSEIEDYQGLSRTLVEFNPRAKFFFENPDLLERYGLRFFTYLSGKISSYIVSSNRSAQEIEEYSHALIEEMIYALESSQNILEERTWFIWKYSQNEGSLGKLGGKLFQDKYRVLLGQGLSQEEAAKQIMSEAFEEVLIESGNPNMYQFYSVQVEQNPNDTASLAKLERLKVVAHQADERGRNLYLEITDPGISPQERAKIIVPDNSLSQVGPDDVIFNILQEGTLPDSLLKGTAIDQEEVMSSHVAQTKKIPGFSENRLTTIQSRLPEYGNPRSPTANRVYDLPQEWEYQPYGRTDGIGDHGIEGYAHMHVFGGIPSKYMRVIVWQPSHDSVGIENVKQQIARNGWYIPIVNKQGEVLLSPDEFDLLRAIYYPLENMGYPTSVSNDVYNYYLSLQSLNNSKHKIVLERAINEISQQIAQQSNVTINLAVLSNYLQSNDLNSRSIEWYAHASFDDIMLLIRESTGNKLLERTREIIDFANAQLKQTILEIEDDPQKIREMWDQNRRAHGFLNTFLNMQLPYITSGISELGERVTDAYLYFDWLIFSDIRRMISGDQISSDAVVDTEKTKSLAKFVNTQQQQIMRKIWDESWVEVRANSDAPSSLLNLYSKTLAPMLSGSIGRGEGMLGSDLDYLILADDEGPEIQQSGFEKDEYTSQLSSFVEKQLAPIVNRKLIALGVRADAGLAKQDRQPLTFVSNLKTYQIKFNTNERQAEEPTEIMSMTPVFGQHSPLVAKAKRYIFENPDSDSMVLYLENLNFEYRQNFLETHEHIASGKTLNNIKTSLQRVLLFKLYSYTARANKLGLLSLDDIEKLPSNIWDLSTYLKDHHLLSEEEDRTIQELLSVSYKLRFLSELYSAEGQDTTSLRKVEELSFKVEEMSYDQREKLFAILHGFRKNFLYKDPYEFVVRKFNKLEIVKELITQSSLEDISQTYNPTDCSNCLAFTRSQRKLLTAARASANFGHFDTMVSNLELAQDVVDSHSRENLVVEETAEAQQETAEALLALEVPDYGILKGERSQLGIAAVEIQQAIDQIERDKERAKENSSIESSVIDQFNNLQASLENIKVQINQEIEKFDSQRLNFISKRKFFKVNPGELTPGYLQTFFTGAISTGPRSTFAQLTGKGIEDGKTVEPRRDAWIVGDHDSPVALITRTHSTGLFTIKLNRNIVINQRPDVMDAIENALGELKKNYPDGLAISLNSSELPDSFFEQEEFYPEFGSKRMRWNPDGAIQGKEDSFATSLQEVVSASDTQVVTQIVLEDMIKEYGLNLSDHQQELYSVIADHLSDELRSRGISTGTEHAQQQIDLVANRMVESLFKGYEVWVAQINSEIDAKIRAQLESHNYTNYNLAKQLIDESRDQLPQISSSAFTSTFTNTALDSLLSETNIRLLSNKQTFFLLDEIQAIKLSDPNLGETIEKIWASIEKSETIKTWIETKSSYDNEATLAQLEELVINSGDEFLIQTWNSNNQLEIKFALERAVSIERAERWSISKNPVVISPKLNLVQRFNKMVRDVNFPRTIRRTIAVALSTVGLVAVALFASTFFSSSIPQVTVQSLPPAIVQQVQAPEWVEQETQVAQTEIQESELALDSISSQNSQAVEQEAGVKDDISVKETALSQQSELEQFSIAVGEIINTFQIDKPQNYDQSGKGLTKYITDQLITAGFSSYLNSPNFLASLRHIEQNYLIDEDQEVQCLGYVVLLSGTGAPNAPISIGGLQTVNNINGRIGSKADQARDMIPQEIISNELRSVSLGQGVFRKIFSLEELYSGDLFFLYENANHVASVIDLKENEDGQVIEALVSDSNRLKNPDGSITEDGMVRTRWVTTEEFEQEFVVFENGLVVYRSYEHDAKAKLRQDQNQHPHDSIQDAETVALSEQEVDLHQNEEADTITLGTPLQISLETQSPYEGFAESQTAPNGSRIFTDRGQEYLPISEVDMPSSSVRNVRSRENLLSIINWFNVEESERYQPRMETDQNGNEYTPVTYCNILAWDLSRAMNVELPRYSPQYNSNSGKVEVTKTNANWLNLWLTGDGADRYGWEGGIGSEAGWAEVSAQEAQDFANQGQPVVGSIYNPNGPGYIAFVMPGSGATIDGNYYPTVANAGRIVGVGLNAYEAFEGWLTNSSIPEEERNIHYFVNQGSYQFVSLSEVAQTSQNSGNQTSSISLKPLIIQPAAVATYMNNEYPHSVYGNMQIAAETLNQHFSEPQNYLSSSNPHFSYLKVMDNFQGEAWQQTPTLEGAGACDVATLVWRALQDFSSSLGVENFEISNGGWGHDLVDLGIFTVRKIDHSDYPFPGKPDDEISVYFNSSTSNYNSDLEISFKDGLDIPEDLRISIEIEEDSEGNFKAEIISNYSIEELQSIVFEESQAYNQNSNSSLVQEILDFINENI